MKNKDRTLKHLQDLLERIPQVRAAGHRSPEFEQWREESLVAIRQAFTENSDHWRTFESILFSPMVSPTTSSELQRSFEGGLVAADAKLKAMITEVKRYWPSEPRNDAARSAAHTDVLDTSNRKVFVIHGHDTTAKLALARFLEQLDLDPVILDEQPSKGNTIIEKFDENAAVSYAVALLTPDDAVVAAGESAATHRARQNVIFELGYFIGKLGRNRVCALTKGAPEIPSDYSGVGYIPMDSGEWKIALAKELDEAGFDINMNKLKQ